MLWKGKVEKWSLDIVMKDNDDDDDFVLAFMYICICNGRNKPKFVIDVQSMPTLLLFLKSLFINKSLNLWTRTFYTMDSRHIWFTIMSVFCIWKQKLYPSESLLQCSVFDFNKDNNVRKKFNFVSDINRVYWQNLYSRKTIIFFSTLILFVHTLLATFSHFMPWQLHGIYFDPNK